MRKFGKLLSLLLVLALVFSVPVNTAKAANDTYAGKTIILHSNDVHGDVADYAAIKALKTSYENQGAEVILVDAGDYSQGTTYVSSSKGQSAVTLMNKVGYTFATLGNHEFDYGYPQLKKNMKKAKFTVLCANVLNKKGNSIYEANKVYTTKSGLKIGFFGINTPESQTKANPALIQGLTFLAEEEMYECAQAQVTALRATDLVVCVAHLGVDAESAPNTSYDLYANTKGISLIIDGHSHTTMTQGPNGEPIQSTGTKFNTVGVVVIDDASKKIEDNYLVKIGTEVTAEEAALGVRTAFNGKAPAVVKAAAKIQNEIDTKYGEVFAKSEVTLNGEKAPGNRTEETNNGDIITDSMVWKVMQNASGLTVDADHVVAITNGGGIRAAIGTGDVTMNDVFTVLPFGNTIAVVYVTGAELLEALEASTYCTPTAVGGFPQVSGISFTVDTSKEYLANDATYPGSTYYGPKKINRVTIDSINGKKFNKKDVYAVITNNFCAAGGDTYYAFASASSQFDTGVPLDEALMEYITVELKGVIGSKYAAPQGRITVK